MKGEALRPLSLKSYLKEISVDDFPNLNSFDFESYLSKNLHLNTFFSFGSLTFYVLDYRTKQYSYFGNHAKSVLGHSREAFLEGGLDFTMKNILEEDLNVYVKEIFRNRLQFLHSIPSSEIVNYWFSHNYRLKRANGDWCHIVQQSTVLESDSNNNPHVVLGFCFNITPYKSDNRIIEHIYKKELSGEFIQMKQQIHYPEREENLLSKREVEILKWMTIGLNSKTIASKLNLSLHTISTHRKNMLEKTKAINTADLINYATKRGII